MCNTRIWHTNINEDGEVCLSLLRQNSYDSLGKTGLMQFYKVRLTGNLDENRGYIGVHNSFPNFCSLTSYLYSVINVPVHTFIENHNLKVITQT